MTAIPIDLPPMVEATIATCSQFQIVVVGKSGVGKSSLIKHIFNIAVEDIDIFNDCARKADITYGHTSESNMRFILHDSLGFEPGTIENWEIVEKFLWERNVASLPLQVRVHAIWYLLYF
ncbi:hypothetical protein CVT25_001193 [Psilocybe cyanescens]|uniref:G domain-containing protein n=1 Tax=Psilocybe cyanescens TaxID=93625 RepID=A0A409XB01_PSICY|nr:hypothetical protein CVT25_001193 [Psilocybe cyanescens]